MGIMHNLVIVNIILKLIKYLIRMDKRKLDYVPPASSRREMNELIEKQRIKLTHQLTSRGKK